MTTKWTNLKELEGKWKSVTYGPPRCPIHLVILQIYCPFVEGIPMDNERTW